MKHSRYTLVLAHFWALAAVAAQVAIVIPVATTMLLLVTRTRLLVTATTWWSGKTVTRLTPASRDKICRQTQMKS